MSATPRWIAISAASALGLGVLAAGAVGVANAMPLIDTTTTAEVPPISTVPGDVKGAQGFDDSGALVFPVPSSTPDATTPAAPPSATVQQVPVPQPQPVAPDSVSVASPGSISVASPGSVASDD